MTGKLPGPRLTLPKEGRLRTKRDYQFFKTAPNVKRTFLGPFSVLMRENGLDRSRLGIIASRRSGSSVRRSRLKRIAREAFRTESPFWGGSVDVLFIAKNLPPKPPQRKKKRIPVEGGPPTPEAGSKAGSKDGTKDGSGKPSKDGSGKPPKGGSGPLEGKSPDRPSKRPSLKAGGLTEAYHRLFRRRQDPAG